MLIVLRLVQVICACIRSALKRFCNAARVLGSVSETMGAYVAYQQVRALNIEQCAACGRRG